jgi:glycosyltransferase involved in cell wall biosynthesis
MTVPVRRPRRWLRDGNRNFPRRLAHVWQEHRGFRAGEIRNRAILESRGDYCIFLDGDCLARPDFVASHRALAEPAGS